VEPAREKSSASDKLNPEFLLDDSDAPLSLKAIDEAVRSKGLWSKRVKGMVVGRGGDSLFLRD